MNISGVVVRTFPRNIDNVWQTLEQFEGVEVHGANEDGRLVVTIEKQAAGKVYVAWSSAHECEDGFLVTGVLRRSDRVGSPIKAHVDITILSPDGHIIDTARSNEVYVPRRRTGRGQSMQRFRVQLPDIPPRGSSVRMVSHSGLHDDAT